MHLNKWSLNHAHASRDKRHISTCVDQTFPVPTIHKMNLNMCWPNTSLVPTYPMLASIQKPAQHVLTKHIPCSDDTKLISTCFDQTFRMPARTQNELQHVLNKPLPFQRGNKMYLNMCWPNPFMPARTKNASNHVITKQIQCQLGHKMHLNMCSPNTSYASEDKKK